MQMETCETSGREGHETRAESQRLKEESDG